MATGVDKEAVAAQIDEDLQRLEMNIRQLKIQFDMYFAGGLKKPPYLLRSNIVKVIKQYSEKRISKYRQRFQFNALVSRFNVLNEMWSKRVRLQEEGDRRMPTHLARKHDRLVASCTVGDPQGQAESLREIHRSFMAERQAAGEDKPISFDKFLRGVAAQTRELQKTSDCAEIELRVVVKDGKVQLKARSVKA